MRTERLAVLLLLITSGCAGIRTDLAGVRDVTKLDIADVAGKDVDPGTSDEARQMLKKPLDAETAARIALLENRELRATLREMGISRGRLVQAWTLPRNGRGRGPRHSTLEGRHRSEASCERVNPQT